MGLVDAGFGVAPVDYRLPTAASFPSQVHDIKAAIRFLRGNWTGRAKLSLTPDTA